MVIKYMTGKTTKVYSFYCSLAHGADAIHMLNAKHYQIIKVMVG